MVLLTQLDIDYSSELSPAEQWFECLAHSLSLLAPTPSLSQVQTALLAHLGQRVERVLPRLANPEDPEQWLSLVLKANFLIRLWRTKDEPVLVAMNVSGGQAMPQSQVKLIESSEFSVARKDLGISKHWCLTIQNLEQAPSKDELLDMLYAQLDDQSECAVIDLG
ncbi:hypothetical protein [Chlorogloea sp. CCALA 695]|uniref:hypothetical protein n=1 Tax=Chlorogloea sp. CCALA 695 TaxID=2107693 RepID=UPI000D0833C1|nr:hypothetical protein [Chlorogloea sp. CCALA 695]PSB27615.1 hypothetical protein C7B70_22070 [Chlorogloea sp. CCALA 695]